MQLVDLATFKTHKCDQKHHQILGPQYFNCPYFHSKIDKRRNPYSQNLTQMTYSEAFVQDFYSIDMCSNFIQYLYHPKNYKTLPCKSRKNRNYEAGLDCPGSCPHIYCPYIHQNEDVSGLLPYRNISIKASPDDLQIKGVRQFLQILEKPKDSLAKYEKEIDEFKASLRKIKSVIKEQVKEVVKYVPKAQDKKQQVLIQNIQNNKSQTNQKWYTAYTYFQCGERLPIIEDRHHQFKNFRDIINNSITAIVMKYIAAFLNSEGGVLYIGVDDNSVVNGFEITQHQFDKFLLSIDKQGKYNLYPPLMPQKYSVKRIPVYHHRRNKDLWVIQIKITPFEREKKTLTTYNRECFMRMNASTHKLDALDLIEYLRLNQEERMSDKEALKEVLKGLEKTCSKSSQQLQQLKQLTNQLSVKIDSLTAPNTK